MPFNAKRRTIPNLIIHIAAKNPLDTCPQKGQHSLRARALWKQQSLILPISFHLILRCAVRKGETEMSRLDNANSRLLIGPYTRSGLNACTLIAAAEMKIRGSLRSKGRKRRRRTKQARPTRNSNLISLNRVFFVAKCARARAILKYSQSATSLICSRSVNMQQWRAKRLIRYRADKQLLSCSIKSRGLRGVIVPSVRARCPLPEIHKSQDPSEQA